MQIIAKLRLHVIRRPVRCILYDWKETKVFFVEIKKFQFDQPTTHVQFYHVKRIFLEKKLLRIVSSLSYIPYDDLPILYRFRLYILLQHRFPPMPTFLLIFIRNLF